MNKRPRAQQHRRGVFTCWMSRKHMKNNLLLTSLAANPITEKERCVTGAQWVILTLLITIVNIWNISKHLLCDINDYALIMTDASLIKLKELVYRQRVLGSVSRPENHPQVTLRFANSCPSSHPNLLSFQNNGLMKQYLDARIYTGGDHFIISRYNFYSELRNELWDRLAQPFSKV